MNGRRENGAFLVEGPRAVSQTGRQFPDCVMEVLVDGTREVPPIRDAPVSRLTARQFKGVASSQNPQGIAAVVRLPDDVYSDRPPSEPGRRVLLLDDVQDPGNVGTLVRSAAAFGFDGILLTAKCADPFAPKCVQASAGSMLSLWLRRTPSCYALAEELTREKGFVVIAADVAGEEQVAGPVEHPFVLALGNEGGGLSERCRNLARFVMSIPIERERVESLNVAAAGAVCMYSLVSPARRRS
ncbi:MAG: hypothetical protein GF418_00780 [Chitinivibrionales bacterium]|nr:hypothetical protein [Chitinivibrionales bacterium]MBD3394135.1 hypothetical protein [Chitinivibrionales bacterium]